MKNIVLIVIVIVLFITSCKVNQPTSEPIEKFGTKEYYQKYQRNIDRLYQMLQGTFVCYSMGMKQDAKPIPWKVNNEQDSVVLYTVPIKEPQRDGYWLICYQFITSLPDNPIYCGVQRISAINRDTFLSEFFDSPVEIKLTDMIKDLGKVSKSIDLKQLTPKDEVVTYYREEITLFKGFSNIYKDHQKQNMSYRREDYEVHPNNMQFISKYFKDIAGEQAIKRPTRIAIQLRTTKNVSYMIDQSLVKR